MRCTGWMGNLEFLYRASMYVPRIPMLNSFFTQHSFR